MSEQDTPSFSNNPFGGFFSFTPNNNTTTTTNNPFAAFLNTSLEEAISSRPIFGGGTSDSSSSSLVDVVDSQPKQEETKYSIDSVISVFSESILGITESKGRHHQVYLLDISDVSNISKVIISEFDINVKGQEQVNCGFKNVSLDFESLVLNKIENDSKKVRGVCKLFKREYPVIESAIISDWKPHSMSLNNVIRTQDYTVIGFVDQLAVATKFGCKNPFLENSSTECLFTEELILDSNSVDQYAAIDTDSPLVVLLPCENCKERKYSLNGLCFNGSIFLFDLKERKFTKSVKFTDESLGKQFILKRFMDNPEFIPYLDGNRLRSFVLSEQKLYEFYWNVQYEELVCVEHCMWVSGQISQVRITDEEFGFIISTWDKKIVLYKPGQVGKPYNEGHVRIIEKEKVLTPSIWCSKSKVLFERSTYYNYVPLNFENHNLTLEEITKSEVKNPFQLFNIADYAKEFEFSCYDELIDNCLSIKKIKVGRKLKGLRSEFIYKVDNKELAVLELEIIAGLTSNQSTIMVETTSIRQSENFKLLELKDFTNFLGAPIIYKRKDEKKFQFTSFIDLKDGKKSSETVIFGDINEGSGSTSTSSTPISNLEFIGLLAPKQTRN
ncbi:predicted protein [Naegleria gruberi]|uniref:Predicted protein n=1 Tax=Naegleria gruberi TaxID=5762 RepID=D2VB14_NAEGR|nr:uncharacterized protein NAEGRDRAFT_66052 [Naegleria gruberi]EFC46042.1 predicted protein [Naegleria gruberi]|eukprot:XP_002678786.1 predicted protein [Naegleria gruberi strain NEG-M]